MSALVVRITTLHVRVRKYCQLPTRLHMRPYPKATKKGKLVHMDVCGRFYNLRVPFCGCPSNKSPLFWSVLEPLVFENYHAHIRTRRHTNQPASSTVAASSKASALAAILQALGLSINAEPRGVVLRQVPQPFKSSPVYPDLVDTWPRWDH